MKLAFATLALPNCVTLGWLLFWLQKITLIRFWWECACACACVCRTLNAGLSFSSSHYHSPERHPTGVDTFNDRHLLFLSPVSPPPSPSYILYQMHVLFIFFLKFFKLEDNCYTILWWSLPSTNMNQSSYIYIIYIYISPPSCSSLPPLHPSRSSQSGLGSLYSTAASY